MNLQFPTFLPFPLYPTRPTEGDEAGATSFLEALNDFLHHLFQQHTSTRHYFDAAGFYFNDSNQENADRSRSAEVSQEAISAVIKNITHPAKGEYVWDAAKNCWVLKLTPI
jgi:hypothetical protein